MGKETVKDPGYQNSIFLFDILLNLMKVGVSSSIYAVNL